MPTRAPEMQAESAAWSIRPGWRNLVCRNLVSQPAQTAATGSHHRRNTDPHRAEYANQLAPNHGRGCQQKIPPPLIRFAQDWIAVIESVEKLRQLKRMLGKISRFGGRDALAYNIRGLSSRKPELPDVVIRFAVKELRKTFCRDAACRVSAERIRIQSPFAENVGSADNRILRIRPRVALETQR